MNPSMENVNAPAVSPASSGASPLPNPGVQPVVSPPSIIQLKKILTPLDFSQASQKALKYATAFAEQFKASLMLLHVVEFSLVGSDFGAVELSRIMTDLQDNASKQLEDWARRDVGTRVPVETLVRSGRPSTEIVEAARTLESDLILIASHGHSSLAHVVLGSTVERVVRHAPCPVLVVRPQEHEFV